MAPPPADAEVEGIHIRACQGQHVPVVLMIANATAEEFGGHGRAPWTRLNDLQPNTVYSVDDPPPMIPEGQDRGEVLIPRYARELLRMD